MNKNIYSKANKNISYLSENRNNSTMNKDNNNNKDKELSRNNQRTIHLNIFGNKSFNSLNNLMYLKNPKEIIQNFSSYRKKKESY